MAASNLVKGKAPLTMVLAEDGARSVYVYADQPVPAGADESDVKRLIDEGYLVEVKPDTTSAKDATDEQGGGQSGTGPTQQGGAGGKK
jgi:hypothetical protein